MDVTVTLEQLHASLQDVATGVYSGKEPDLFYALEKTKPQLIKLLDFGPRSATERQALKEGSYAIFSLLFILINH